MSTKKMAEGLVRAGETEDTTPTLFWWQQGSNYWDLPFYAEMDCCCDGLAGDPGDWQAAREQLWAMREKLV